MLVKTLIKRLEKFDGNLPVIVDGYEGGVEDVTKVLRVEMVKNQNNEWYYGKHEIVKRWKTLSGERIEAVYLPRQ